MDESLAKVIAELLNYSFKDISNTWEGLTREEREIIGSKERFEELVEWVSLRV